MNRLFAVSLAFILTVASSYAWGEEQQTGPNETTKLTPGQAAPDFELPKAEGATETKKLSDFKGKKNVLIAFYPKAFTPGCTKQLCGYRDDFKKFEDSATEVVAISIDEQDYSDKFKAEYKMPFIVLGDNEGKIVDKYGVKTAQRGDMRYANRCVFLVDKEGVIRYIDEEYKIGEDEAPLFDAIATLQEGESKKN